MAQMKADGNFFINKLIGAFILFSLDKLNKLTRVSKPLNTKASNFFINFFTGWFYFFMEVQNALFGFVGTGRMVDEGLTSRLDWRFFLEAGLALSCLDWACWFRGHPTPLAAQS
jgi:hypothetical protein